MAVKGDLDKLFGEWDQWGWHRVSFYGDLRRPVEALSQALGLTLIEEAWLPAAGTRSAELEALSTGIGLAGRGSRPPVTLPPELGRPLDQQIPFTRLRDGEVYAPEVGRAPAA